MPSSAVAPADNPEPELDPERLDCYRVALELTALAQCLVPRGHRELRDQLLRASLSVPLNIAEGCGRHAPGEKAHFYAIARGSAMECAAVIDVVRSLALAPSALWWQPRAW